MSETPVTPNEKDADNLRTDKLNSWSADKSINPKDLGLSQENAEAISTEFENRAFAETDIASVVEGIIPKESLFNPNSLPSKIQTQTGDVPVMKTSGFAESARNIIRKMFKFEAAGAVYSPTKSEIIVRSRLDRFSTTAAIAMGAFRDVLGPVLAHEAGHAFQDIDHQMPNKESTRQTIARASQMVKSEKGLSYAEAIALDGRSRDLAIVTESHSYVIQYMLTGGDMRPDQVKTLRDVVNEQKNIDPDKILVNEIPLTSYSENGFASVLDYVESNVKTYLPQKDRENPDYLNRIRSVTVQIVRLLAIGATNLQVADLIRQNYESIHQGKEWNHQTNGYDFLTLEKTDPLAGSLPPDDELVKRFNASIENRVMKVSQIAKDLINK